jgi:hypothetical protein
MQNIPPDLWDVWEAGDFTGPNRPYARITIQKALLRPAYTMKTMFIQDEPQVEFPQAILKSLTIDRRLGTDAAQMTLVIKNNVPVDPMQNLDLSDGGLPLPPTDFRSVRQLRDLGHPGFFTFRRGVNATNQIGWGYAMSTTWVDMLIPNRVIRTWQGYGTDGAANPWDDTRQVLTGSWLIDRVELTATGDITITCRDFLKLAIEQRLYPPVVPLQNYPLTFCADHFVDVYNTVDPPNPASVNVGFHNFEDYDSSVGYVTGVWNDPMFGHTAEHAFDGDSTTYWLSRHHLSCCDWSSFEWISADTNGNPINFVQFRPRWGGYQVYVCVKVNGVWQGSATIPYSPTPSEPISNGSGMAYVAGPINVPSSETWFGITLPERYNAEQVRVVFTNLHIESDGFYRASIYDLEVFDHPFFVGEGDPETTVTEEFVEGNIVDYVDIIKVLAGWAGFYWLEGTPADPILDTFGTPVGRIWGDFFNSGAYPVDPPCIPASFWDNKSVMDGINQIKEILGYIVYCDSTGGLICRMPNIWRTGNYVLGQGFVGSESVRVLDEKKVVLDLGVVLDDASLRSEIIVVSASDRSLHTALTPSWSADLAIPGTVGPQGDAALLAGQERVMLVPNYPFLSQAEVDKFAYLISLWIHWTFRKDKVRIPGCPAFMPDDQVTIYERVTHEQFVHYIEGVSSTMDFQSGTWFMDMDTHWLGEGPDRAWLVNTYSDMPPALYAYLLAIGEIEEGGGDGTTPPVFELPEFASTDVWDRVEDDFSSLFPGLPTINTSIATMSDEELAALYGSTYVVPPSGGSGGTVVNRSEAFYWATWGAPASNQVSMSFMVPWQSIYNSPPIGYPVPENTSVSQVSFVNITCHAVAVPAFRLLAAIIGEELYYVKPSQTGAYNYRYIAGTSVLSVHSWGLAIDVNWTDNAVNKASSLINVNWKTAAQRAVAEIRTNNGQRVFEWGGNWSSKKDWMHLEVVCTAADMKTGVHR